MNLYGWDILFATNLDTINAKFKANSQLLASTFHFTSKDPFSGATVTVSGQFGKWSVAAKGSNLLVRVILPVTGLSISGLENNTMTNGSCNVTVELNLNFISDKSNADNQSLVFDYSDDGSSTGNKNISLISIDQMDPVMNDNQKSLVGQSIIACLQANPETLNYNFATVILKNENDDWLSPDYVAFDMPTLSNGKSYFCIFGNAGPNKGQAGQVDPQLFNATDNIYLGISGTLFLERVIMPGMYKSLQGAKIVFQDPKIVVTGFHLASCTIGLVTYYPVIQTMTLHIDGDKIISDINGTCDLYAGISMTFTRSSRDSINLDLSKRTVSILSDPKPVFTHNEDMGILQYLAPLVIGEIGTAIAGIIAEVIGSVIAGSVKDETSTHFLFSTQSLTWTNIDFSEIRYGGIADNFYLTGIAK